MAHAEWDFKLLRPVPEGGTLGDAFASYRRDNGGTPHEEDTGPIVEAPAAVRYLLEWFWECSAGRQVTQVGILGLPATEIAAWASLRRLALKEWEFRALRRLDAAFVGIMNER